MFSKSVRLPAGVWQVRAKAAGSRGPVSPSALISVTGQARQVKARKATVVVTGAKVAKVGPPSGARQVVTFRNAVGLPKVGSVVTMDASAAAPKGVLGRVVSVNRSTRTVVLRPASLSEAYSRYRVSTVTTLRQVVARSGLTAQAQTAAIQALKAAPFKCTGGASAQTITATVDLSSVRASFDFDLGQRWISFLLMGEPKIEMGLEIGAGLRASCSARMPLPEIPVGTTGLLLQVTPKLSLKFGSSAAATFSYGTKGRFAVGFSKLANQKTEYVRSGRFTGFAAAETTKDVSTSLDADLEVLLSVGGRVGVFGEAGAGFEGRLSVASPNQQCLWLGNALNVGLGVKADLFIADWEWTLAKAQMKLPTIYDRCWATGHKPTPVPTPPPARLQIATTAVPSGTIGRTYNTLLTASGGVQPYVWTVKDGSVPSGLTLNRSGALSGTPSTEQSAEFTVVVRDAAGVTAQQFFTLAIRRPDNHPRLPVGGAVGLPGLGYGGLALTPDAAARMCRADDDVTNWTPSRTVAPDLSVHASSCPGYLDRAGNLYDVSRDGSGNPVTRKYNSSGVLLWTAPVHTRPVADDGPLPARTHLGDYATVDPASGKVNLTSSRTWGTMMVDADLQLAVTDSQVLLVSRRPQHGMTAAWLDRKTGALLQNTGATDAAAISTDGSAAFVLRDDNRSGNCSAFIEFWTVEGRRWQTSTGASTGCLNSEIYPSDSGGALVLFYDAFGRTFTESYTAGGVLANRSGQFMPQWWAFSADREGRLAWLEPSCRQPDQCIVAAKVRQPDGRVDSFSVALGQDRSRDTNSVRLGVGQLWVLSYATGSTHATLESWPMKTPGDEVQMQQWRASNDNLNR